MQIHPTSLEFESLPSIYALLDSIVFMWFIILVTLGVIVWVVAKVWHVHSIPKHLAKEKGLAQAKLIFLDVYSRSGLEAIMGFGRTGDSDGLG